MTEIPTAPPFEIQHPQDCGDPDCEVPESIQTVTIVWMRHKETGKPSFAVIFHTVWPICRFLRDRAAHIGFNGS